MFVLSVLIVSVMQTTTNKLDWKIHTNHLYGKGQSRLHVLRRLQSFNICNKLPWVFYQSVIGALQKLLDIMDDASGAWSVEDCPFPRAGQTNRLRNLFVAHAIRLYISSLKAHSRQ